MQPRSHLARAWLRLALLASLAAPACSPYDPSLPDQAFLCASDEPRCPDGYACVTDGKRMVCSKAGAALSDAGMSDAVPPNP